MVDAIGGYFELELPVGRGEYYRDAYRFQSARAAFLALLETGRPNRIWMPWYICGSMIEPLERTGVPIARYHINEMFDIVDQVNLKNNEWLVYINYFGLCGEIATRILDRFPRNRVIIDNSQAFFSPPRDCLATLYSPRKFFGVPDGGYLFTILSVSVPNTGGKNSIQGCCHLLKRLALDPESGYHDFLRAENEFSGQEPQQMSILSRKILGSIGYERAMRRRKQNFDFLHNELRGLNALKLERDEEETPHCYPLLLTVPGVRDKLINERIFVPCYWPEVRDGDGSYPELERRLARDILPIPCDQRYSLGEMKRITELLVGLTN